MIRLCYILTILFTLSINADESFFSLASRESTKINIIIFSKNRAFQLESCIRSLKDKFIEYHQSDITVVYKTTDSKYSQGYAIVQPLYPEIKFLAETNFKANVLDSIHKSNRYTMFLVDDDIFIDAFSIDDDPFQIFLNGEKKYLGVSLRINNKLLDEVDFLELPMDKNAITWKLGKARSVPDHSNYKYSLDGDIFKTSYIRQQIEKINFTNPNNLESELNFNPSLQHNSYKIAYRYERKVFNALVNYTRENLHSIYSISYLNEQILKCQRLNLKNIYMEFPSKIFDSPKFTFEPIPLC